MIYHQIQFDLCNLLWDPKHERLFCGVTQYLSRRAVSQIKRWSWKIFVFSSKHSKHFSEIYKYLVYNVYYLMYTIHSLCYWMSGIHFSFLKVKCLINCSKLQLLHAFLQKNYVFQKPWPCHVHWPIPILLFFACHTGRSLKGCMWVWHVQCNTWMQNYYSY